MSSPISIPDLVRPSFFDGQRLDAADLSAIYEFHRQLRWLHNRALHAWGIATGYGVSGKKRGREVTVAPGYAIDCEGHDLVLSRAQTLPVPPIAGAPTGGPTLYYLTASYVSDADLTADESRDGPCEGSGAVRRTESPRLRFQNPRDVTSAATRFRRGLDIVLASVLIENCVLVDRPSTSERRDARPATQPFIAGGSTPAGGTPWQFFPPTGAAQGVQTVVDTSAAGFQQTPSYVAHVIGSRQLSGGPVIDGIASVAQPSPTGFVLQMTLPRNLASGTSALNPDAAFTANLLQQLSTGVRWSVWWVGTEGES
jgi:hypothetical protein